MADVTSIIVHAMVYFSEGTQSCRPCPDYFCSPVYMGDKIPDKKKMHHILPELVLLPPETRDCDQRAASLVKVKKMLCLLASIQTFLSHLCRLLV